MSLYNLYIYRPPRMPWGRHRGGGGVPCQVQPGGGGTLPGPAGGGGSLPGPAGGGVPARSSQGGLPCQVQPGGGGTLSGGTQLGQQKECSLHGGRYASCVHAGGLSSLTTYAFHLRRTLHEVYWTRSRCLTHTWWPLHLLPFHLSGCVLPDCIC